MNMKQKLLTNHLLIGSWISLAHPAIAEIMAHAGFDWIGIDLEHSVITIREAEELIRIIELSGVTPIVRISANDPVQIKRVMDAGAYGIIVPMVNTTNEAKDAVSAVYYPPRGKRGVGLARAQGYGSRFSEYVDRLDNELLVIVQIEHINGVNNLEQILTVKGVDGFFVGPYDLSASLGIPGQFDNSRFLDCMERIHNIGFNSGKAPGIHVVEPELNELQQRISEGYKLIAYSVDIRMLDSACRIGVKGIKRGKNE